MDDINIRPYQVTDRGQVRALCCDVADRGDPIEHFFPDRQLAADLLTRYYTDYEPQSTFVAQRDGRLVGYINGCMDNRRYGLVMFWILIPCILAKAFKRGIFFRREFWRITRDMLRNWRRLFAWRQTSFHSHQGHLHIGIARHVRHQRLGMRLVGALSDYAATQGVGELTASVNDGNIAASRFFERLGFVVRDRYPMVMTGGKQGASYHALCYVKKII